MADDRLVVTSRGLCRVPEGDDGIPIEEVYPGDTLPRSMRGTKFYETPQGYVLGKPLEASNDQGPQPVRFPSRENQIAHGDAEFWARLDRDYAKVKITAPGCKDA